MKFPKISIITPSFNQGKYIEETILSVLQQNYPELEYIIIDGGSSDNTVEVIKKYDKDLTYWVSEKDNGQAHAINKGLKIATGDIVAYINSDDYYLPGCFYSVVNLYLQGHLLISGGVRYIDDKRETLKEHLPNYASASQIFQKWIGGYNAISQPGVFWSSNFTKEIGVFDDSLNFCFDIEYWTRILQKGYKFYFTEEIFSVRRLHEDCKTITSSNSFNLEQRFIFEKYTKDLSLLERKQAKKFRNEVICRDLLTLAGKYFKQKRFLKGFLNMLASFIKSPLFFLFLIISFIKKH